MLTHLRLIEELRVRGGAHIFYGLAEIKINEITDVNEDQLDDN